MEVEVEVEPDLVVLQTESFMLDERIIIPLEKAEVNEEGSVPGVMRCRSTQSWPRFLHTDRMSTCRWECEHTTDAKRMRLEGRGGHGFDLFWVTRCGCRSGSTTSQVPVLPRGPVSEKISEMG